MTELNCFEIQFSCIFMDCTKETNGQFSRVHFIVIHFTKWLCSHKYEYDSSTVRVPISESRQTRVCVYFIGGHSHTHDYGLPVNFTRTSSFCAGHVFIQLMQSKLCVNSTNKTYKSCGTYLTSELTSL